MNPVTRAIEAAGGPSKVAHALNVSAQAVCFWRDGKRKFPSDHAAQLEAAGNYQVRRWEMFPGNWHRIWPELIRVPGAPTPAGAIPSRTRNAGVPLRDVESDIVKLASNAAAVADIGGGDAT